MTYGQLNPGTVLLGEPGYGPPCHVAIMLSKQVNDDGTQTMRWLNFSTNRIGFSSSTHEMNRTIHDGNTVIT